MYGLYLKLFVNLFAETINTALVIDRDLAGGVRKLFVELLRPGLVPGLFVLDRARDGLVLGALGGADGQIDIRFGFFVVAGHGACGEDGERGQDGRDERLPGEGGVAH